MSVKLERKDKEIGEPKGLVDGGHTIIRCADCNKALVDIWHTKPKAIDPRTNKPFEWKFMAECCYCHGRSYIITVTGSFHIGGYGVNSKDANEAYEKTSIVDQTEMQGREDVIYIKTARFGQSGK